MEDEPLFRLLLSITGLWLFVRSRTSSRIRSQITRDFTVTLSSKNGVARTFVFENRLAGSRSGADQNSIVSLTFSNGWQAVKTFIAKDAVHKMVRGLAVGEITYKGDLPYLLWFYEMAMSGIPGRDRSVTKIMPSNYLEPDLNCEFGGRSILREPAVSELDPEWKNAHAQREKIIIWSVGRGGEVAGKQVNYPHVVSAPYVGAAEES
jgi:hypothetical protein